MPVANVLWSTLATRMLLFAPRLRRARAGRVARTLPMPSEPRRVPLATVPSILSAESPPRSAAPVRKPRPPAAPALSRRRAPRSHAGSGLRPLPLPPPRSEPPPPGTLPCACDPSGGVTLPLLPPLLLPPPPTCTHSLLPASCPSSSGRRGERGGEGGGEDGGEGGAPPAPSGEPARRRTIATGGGRRSALRSADDQQGTVQEWPRARSFGCRRGERLRASCVRAAP